MANPALQIVSITTANYIFDNIWSVDQVEAYIVMYQPGGISLTFLRRVVGYGFHDAATYARLLAKTAAILYTLGHTKTVPQVLLEMLLHMNPLRLTSEQVGIKCTFYLVVGEKGGGGISICQRKRLLVFASGYQPFNSSFYQ